MTDEKGQFNVLLSIEQHIEALKPLLPKQAMVGIGEYSIKTLLKDPTVRKEGTLPIFIEKFSDDIYKWLPKGYDPFLVLGFEDNKIDTHFWYDVQFTVLKDNSIIQALKRKPAEKLHNAIILSSIWDGIGSATLPTLVSKFRAATIDSLSIAVMPSKIQPPDAHFNAFAAVQLCQATEGSTVLLLDRDQVESYEGVDRKGDVIRGNIVINYLLNLFLAKETLVSEIAELSRTFNVKLFSGIIVTGASYKIYGSFENMLNAAWLKPSLKFDTPSATLLYVLLRMPLSLKDKLPRAKIEMTIADWFKEKTSLQSIYITEPIYTEDMSDRVDAVLFVGGFDASPMFADQQRRIERLKKKAVAKGFMTEDWQVISPKIEEPEVVEVKTTQIFDALPPTPEEPVSEAPTDIETKPLGNLENLENQTLQSTDATDPPKVLENTQTPTEPATWEEPKAKEKTRRNLGIIGRLTFRRRKKTEKIDEQKKENSA